MCLCMHEILFRPHRVLLRCYPRTFALLWQGLMLVCLQVGVSSVVMDLHAMAAKDPVMADACLAYQEQRALDLLVIMVRCKVLSRHPDCRLADGGLALSWLLPLHSVGSISLQLCSKDFHFWHWNIDLKACTEVDVTRPVWSIETVWEFSTKVWNGECSEKHVGLRCDDSICPFHVCSSHVCSRDRESIQVVWEDGFHGRSFFGRNTSICVCLVNALVIC